MIIHLTARAVAWLRGENHRKVKLGKPACGKNREPGAATLDYCGTEDVRALAHGTEEATILRPLDHNWDRESGLPRPWGFEVWVKRKPQMPTCKECQVILDGALQETMQLPLVVWELG